MAASTVPSDTGGQRRGGRRWSQAGLGHVATPACKGARELSSARCSVGRQSGSVHRSGCPPPGPSLPDTGEQLGLHVRITPVPSGRVRAMRVCLPERPPCPATPAGPHTPQPRDPPREPRVFPAGVPAEGLAFPCSFFLKRYLRCTKRGAGKRGAPVGGSAFLACLGSPRRRGGSLGPRSPSVALAVPFVPLRRLNRQLLHSVESALETLFLIINCFSPQK